MFFIDRANHYNPVPHLGSYEATNPCGEQPLLPYDVCNLGSINLGPFVKQNAPASAAPEDRVDWEALRRVVRHMTDQLPQMNLYYATTSIMVANRMLNVGAGATWDAHEWDVR